MEPFFKSDIFWLTVPFLTDEQRVPWISRCAEVQTDAPDGTVVTLDKFKIVYVKQASLEMIVEARQADLVFDFTRSLHAAGKTTTPYSTVNYPGKNRMRWIYPLKNKRPSFLHFYYLDSSCSKIAAFLFSILFHFRRWIRKYSFTLHSAQLPLPEQMLQTMNASDYCIRLGTRGTDRSIVVAYARGNRSIAFGKYASNHTALSSLDHERQALLEVHRTGRFETPAVINAENSLLIISSVRPDHVTQENTLSPELVRGLVHFYKDSAQIGTLLDIMPWNHVRGEAAAWARDARMEVKIISQWLLKLMDSFDPTTPIAVSAAHGDLTPWNLYRAKNHFHIFDWKLYAQQRPLLFDFFHYILQKNIYSGKGSSDDIRKELKGLKTHPDVLSLLTRHHTSWDECLHQFLVVQTPHFLKQYAQGNAAALPIVRETRRLQILGEFMKEAIGIRGLTGRNEEFYEELENHLNNHHQYALLQFFHPSLREMPAHEVLDITLPHHNLQLFLEFLDSHNYVGNIQHTASGPATRLKITFADNTILQVNCIHRFQHKELCYLSIDDLLRSRVTNGRRYTASIFFDFSFYIINQTLKRTAIQGDIVLRFERRAREEQLESTWISTKNFWMNNNSALQPLITANVKKYIHALPMNTFSSRMAYRLNDLVEIVKGMIRFPRVSLPERENRLAPIPAATRTRRML